MTHVNSRNVYAYEMDFLSALLTKRRCYVNRDILRQIATTQLNENATVINKKVLHTS